MHKKGSKGHKGGKGGKGKGRRRGRRRNKPITSSEASSPPPSSGSTPPMLNSAVSREEALKAAAPTLSNVTVVDETSMPRTGRERRRGRKRGGRGRRRGGHDAVRIVDALVARGVNQVYIVGGDGTLRGASKVAEEAGKRGVPIGVAGVPKTVDNDIPIIDKSFGFETAVQAAQAAIQAAKVEATCFPNGIGIVQLMGRNSGFLLLQRRSN